MGATKNGMRAWRSSLCAWSLRFHCDAHNQSFHAYRLAGYLPKQDRVLAVIACAIIILMAKRVEAWTYPLALSFSAPIALNLYWVWLTTMVTPTASRHYLQYRNVVVATWRAVILWSGMQAYQNIDSLGQARSKASFLLHLVLVSRAFSLCIVAVGAVLPFWLHMLMQPFVVLFLFASGTVSNVSASLCSCCEAEVQAAYYALSMLATFTQPIPGALVDTASGVGSVAGKCDVCPAQQLVLFVQLTVGVVLPSVLLYRYEWEARMRYLRLEQQQAGQGWREEVTGDRVARVLGAGLDVCQATVMLTLLWHLLSLIYV